MDELIRTISIQLVQTTFFPTCIKFIILFFLAPIEKCNPSLTTVFVNLYKKSRRKM